MFFSIPFPCALPRDTSAGHTPRKICPRMPNSSPYAAAPSWSHAHGVRGEEMKCSSASVGEGVAVSNGGGNPRRDGSKAVLDFIT